MKAKLLYWETIPCPVYLFDVFKVVKEFIVQFNSVINGRVVINYIFKRIMGGVVIGLLSHFLVPGDNVATVMLFVIR